MSFVFVWGYFFETPSSSSEIIRAKDSLVPDIYLSTKEGDLIEAHKNVLKLASPFFNWILQEEPDRKIIDCSNYSKTVVDKLVQMMYTGRTTVQVASFVEFAYLCYMSQIRDLERKEWAIPKYSTEAEVQVVPTPQRVIEEIWIVDDDINSTSQ